MMKSFLTIIVCFIFSFVQAQQDKYPGFVPDAGTMEWAMPSPGNEITGTYTVPDDELFACGKPTNLVTSGITQTTAFISWRAVSGAFSYTIEVQRAYVSAAWVYAGVAGTNSFTLTNLAPNELYYWRVRTNCSSSFSAYATSPFFFTQPVLPCPAPTLTYAYPTTITATSAVLGWGATAGAQSYTVEYRVVGSGTWLLGGTPLQSTLTLTGLTPATNYEFRIRTNCANGSSEFTVPTQFTTSATSCIPPVSVSITDITTNSATVSWPLAPGGINYTVDLKPAGTPTWTLVFSTSTFYQTSISVSNLAAGTLYDCRLRSVCGDGSTSDGILTQFVTSAAACNAPTGLFSSEITEFGALLSWGAVAGAESYTIEFKAATSATWITAASTLGTSLRLLNINPATVYDWRVRSNCPGGVVSSYSTAQFTTAPASGGTCATPTGLSNFDDCGYAELSWLPVPGALGYRVEYKLTTSATWLLSAGNTVGTSVGITGAAGNYNWRVQANCASGTSAFANGTARILSAAFCNQKIQKQVSSAAVQEGKDGASLKVSPQPARNELTVSYLSEENAAGQIAIINQLGAAVLRNNITVRRGSNTARLNVSMLLPGAYILQVKTKSRTESIKIIIK